jgi:DinB superfamily
MSSATATPAIPTATSVLREQLGAITGTLRRNTAGLTQLDSLVQPHTGGNCLNWIVGHLDWVNEQALSVLGQPPVLGEAALHRYHRGTPELHDSGEALSLDQLLQAWDESSARIGAALESITPEKLYQPAPFSPRKKSDETVLSLLTIMMFHQAYHAGQTGLLRRIAGKEGAIK